MTRIMTRISLIKADVGGYPGHSSVHPALMVISRIPGAGILAGEDGDA